MWDNTPDSNMVEAIKLYNLHIYNTTAEEKLPINKPELFPNPASQSFTVRLQQGIAEISISDVTGRLLFRDSFENGIFEKTFSLSECYSKQGVLIVVVKDNAGNTYTERLVVL